MIKPRTVIIAVFAIALISLADVVIRLASPPDSGGLGADSYGTYPYGYRAYYELLGAMGISTERAVVPPTAFLAPQRCLLFLSPDPNLVALEPEYLRKAADWVEGGGEVLVAPALPNITSRGEREKKARSDLFREGGGSTALAELGLSGVHVDSVERLRAKALGEPPPKESPKQEGRRPFDFGLHSIRIQSHTIRTEGFGTLAPLGDQVKSLDIPASRLQVIDTASTTTPLGGLLFRDDRGTSYFLAAVYDRGQGRVVVLSDPRLARNEMIGEGGNAVALVHLVALSGKTAVFDEFYHGLTVRGNPVWLLTRQPYGFLAVLLALAVGLWVWRQGTPLGPPLRERLKPRRNLREYVEAMANLFSASRCRHFVGRETLDGVLWALRRRLGLSAGASGPEDIARVIARRDPERARRFLDSVADAEKILNTRPQLTIRELIQLTRNLMKCL